MKNKNSNQSKNRFELLKALFANAPLKASDLEELKSLSKKYDHKLYNYLIKNPEL